MRLIDADAIKRRVVIGGSEQCKKCALAEMLYDIVNAPTVEAEPIRHAKWLPIYYDNQPMICACSLCDRRVINKYDLPRYCPTCGAKMDEEADNE